MCLTERENTRHDYLNQPLTDLSHIGVDCDNDHCDYLDIESAASFKCSPDDLIVIQLNIHGLISKQASLLRLLTTCIKDQKIDVVLLCETWLNTDTKPLVNIPGYTFIGTERENKKGRGVGILLSSESHFKIRHDLNTMEDTLESFFVEMFTKGRNVICGSAYHPPNTNTKTFMNKIDSVMGKIKSETHKDVVIGMDHNLDFLKFEKHKDTELFVSTVLDNSLLPCITKPTRITHSTATLIDNVFVNCKLHSRQKSSIIIHDISDHLPSLVVLENIKIKKKANKKIITREITDCKLEGLKYSLQCENLDLIINGQNPNTDYELLVSKILHAMDTNIPEKEITISAKQFICEPWLTKGLIKCGQKQLHLYEKALKVRNEESLKKYKEYRSTLQRIKRRSKKDYFSKKCIEFKNNTKNLWRTINNIIKNNRDKASTINYLKIDKLKITNAQLITNEFARFFSSVGEKIASKSGNSNIGLDEYLSKIPNQKNSVFLTPCTEQEINDLIKNLPNKFSSGHDNITNVILKEIKAELVTPLATIFNSSLRTGIFPDQMKTANVVPLFKSGIHCLVNNYRPISLLPTISKLLEKVMYSRIYNFLTENDIFFKSQYGFQKKHSCEHAVTELVGEICKGLKNGKHTIALFLDLLKAFDSITHRILFDKLDRYGIRGVALDWFKSYLSERSIRCKCQVANTSNVCYSDKYEIPIRCPQGSCLGPLIFLIYCNDLYRNLELCNGILFADDTTLYKSHEDLRYLQWCIKNDLEILFDWFKANRLSLNGKKSVSILFSKNKEKITKINIPDLEIKFVESTKFLGLWLDERLSWNIHVDKLLGKIKRT